MSDQLAPATLVALQRWPVLDRAFRYGMRAEIAPGVVAHVQPLVRGDHVVVPVVLRGTTQTAWGPIRVDAHASVVMHVASFGAMLQDAEQAGVLPKLSALVDHAQGRPLLLLPR